MGKSSDEESSSSSSRRVAKNGYTKSLAVIGEPSFGGHIKGANPNMNLRKYRPRTLLLWALLLGVALVGGGILVKQLLDLRSMEPVTDEMKMEAQTAVQNFLDTLTNDMIELKALVNDNAITYETPGDLTLDRLLFDFASEREYILRAGVIFPPTEDDLGDGGMAVRYEPATTSFLAHDATTSRRWLNVGLDVELGVRMCSGTQVEVIQCSPPDEWLFYAEPPAWDDLYREVEGLPENSILAGVPVANEISTTSATVKAIQLVLMGDFDSTTGELLSVLQLGVDMKHFLGEDKNYGIYLLHVDDCFEQCHLGVGSSNRNIVGQFLWIDQLAPIEATQNDELRYLRDALSETFGAALSPFDVGSDFFGSHGFQGSQQDEGDNYAYWLDWARIHDAVVGEHTWQMHSLSDVLVAVVLHDDDA